MEQLKIGIFPGSFDPITVGHEYIILKAAKLVDSLVIGIGSNSHKKHQFDVAIREEWVKKTFDSHQNILVKKYDGLTVDFAKKENASFIFRGLRSTIDFEYEKQIAETNSLMNKEIETIFLLASSRYGMISSSIVRQIFINNGDINSLIPNAVNIPIND